MKLSMLILILIFSLVSCHAQTQSYKDEILSKEDLIEDFKLFESSLKSNHPNLDIYSSKEELDSLFENTKSKLRDSSYGIDFYKLLAPIIKHIGNNHTNVFPPETFITFLNTDAKRFPFRLHYDNDTLYVSGDYSNEHIVKEGAVIVSINGVNAIDILNDFVSNISTDGVNKTQPISRASNGFSRYYSYHYNLPDSYEITYLDAEGVLQKADIKALKRSEIAENQKKRNTINIEKQENYSFHISREIGILKIRTFLPASVKDFKKFLKESFEEIEKKRVNHLLIDLRDNYGGFPEASFELLSYLTSNELKPIKVEYAITNKIHNEEYFIEDKFLKHFKGKRFDEKEGVYHVRGSMKTTIEPQKQGFKGKLYILANANSSSTTGQLLGLIKSYTKAQFLGEESGGNPVGIVADDILTMTLPNSQIEVKIPMVYSEVNVHFQNNGHGVIPDKEIKLTIDDILSEDDLVLENSIQWIIDSSQKGKDD